MSYESLPQFLAKIDLFEGLPKETLSELIERGTTLKVPAGSHVVEQGAHDAGLQVVLAGSAVVSVNGVEREPLEVGDYFGEVSLIDGLPRSATVVAGPDGLSTFALSALAFEPVVRANPDVAQSLLKALTARIRSLESGS
ncbi:MULTISPECIES: cyclic nucleotide-binding domain-containing protein [Kribbella]|uniref:Cyclic nucleotide-binding domain-containing protein n=2 Tax=Kribbella TaxID=182639 RepID=A0A4V2M471_9ACTN|nr:MULTISPECIES: cyclic nucleotide-binding domain-containing protein [Kribbella]TCC34842.1 cyclic nucleotide-binding domain-containing protein [Kribbella sindirgiensis]TCC35672.1 cyclic nucleotide-binding domain-containing protein [Kribbella speibonae]